MHIQHAISSNKVILPVEDQPDDKKPTLRALRKINPFADRAAKPLPTLIVLNLQLPWFDGLSVLRAGLLEAARLLGVYWLPLNPSAPGKLA